MRTSIAAMAVLGLSTIAFVGSASAQVTVPKEQDFPATPMQKGAPENLPGENLIPGASLAVHTFNMATQPILQPLLAPEGAAAPAPAAKKKMMMKKRMMKKKM